MSHAETDPYELKLYQMFQSCDTYQNGLLDEDSLKRLCGLLELSDNGAVLIANLSLTGAVKLGISFEQFKEALLQFLGTEMDHHKCDDIDNTAVPVREQTLIISEQSGAGDLLHGQQQQQQLSLSESDDLHATKSAHRQPGSRLQSQHFDSSFSDSEPNEQSATHNEHRNCSPLKCNSKQRCASQTDITKNDKSNNKAGHTFNSGNKLKRCASLPAQPGAHVKALAARTNKALAQQNATNSSSTESLGSCARATYNSNTDLKLHNNESIIVFNQTQAQENTNQLETLAASAIIAIWERANIANGRGILLSLGIDDDDVNLPQLYKVFEDELRILEDESYSNMMRALVALQLAELAMLRDSARQLKDENSKLRNDYKSANERAALMAAEIDERHASLEEVSKNKLQLLEQRHAGTVRDLTTTMASERENWSLKATQYEAKIKLLEQECQQLRADLELLQRENNETDAENQRLQKQNIELLEQNIALNSQIASCDDLGDAETHVQSDKESIEIEVQRLMERLRKLQSENAELRDKNDELVVELENLNLEFAAAKAKLKKYAPNAAQELELQNDEITATQPSACAAEVVQPTDTAEPNKASMALNAELENVTLHAKANEINELKATISRLEQQLAKAQSTIEKTVTIAERCKELEASLEQMQRAYEDCEDYWQNKLNDERQLFEEEQQENEKKFTDLMEKVREYEDQFKSDGRLSPIPEKDILEGQYAELEAETEQVRQQLQEKQKEIEELNNENADLRMRLGESVEILTGAAEYNQQNVDDMIAEKHSAAASPISYLWQQSTIQTLGTQYYEQQEQQQQQSPAVAEHAKLGAGDGVQFSAMLACPASPNKQTKRHTLSTSETSIFSTTLVENAASTPSSSALTTSPIQKRKGENGDKQLATEGEVADCETSSTTSGKSFETHSIASTHSIQRNIPTPTSSQRTSPSNLKEELKRLKYFEITLKEQIKDLSLERDGLIMELQQLQEAKPVLEKAYARTAHPTLIQRVNQLELKNRHMQNVIKQQQQYSETLLQQSWQQHQLELSDLHGRIEQQGVLLAEQTQRLQNADILVKDLYVENSNLTAAVQRLEQQRARINFMHQQQQMHGINGLPGLP